MGNSDSGSKTRKIYAAAALAGCVIAFAGMVAFIPVLTSLVVDHFPENYAWRTQQALNEGNTSRATAIAGARAAVEHYDFTARRLLAKAKLADHRSSEAVEIMQQTLARARSVPRRDIYSIGFDPSADYELLSEALTQEGRTAFADEMARAATDAQRMALGRTDDLGTTNVGVNLQQPVVQTGEQLPMDLTTFQLSPGLSSTSSGSLLFSRNSEAEGAIEIKPQPSQFLRAQVRGGKAMGFGGVLVLLLNGEELIRIYVDNEDSRWVSVPLPMAAFPTTMPLTVKFINDGFDPITKEDRNVELVRLEI